MRSKHRFSTVEAGKHNTCCGCCYCSKKQKITVCTLIWLPIAILVLLVVAILIRTALVEPRFELMRLSADPPVFMNLTDDDKLDMAKRLGEAIQLKTISIDADTQNETALALMRDLLSSKFPGVFSSDFIEIEVVNDLSLLFRVEGRMSTANPYLLCGHLDVVPEGNTDEWSHDPFLGDVIKMDGENFIFGRGTIDDKQAIMGIMESLEYIVNNGIQPNRTFYIGFGHDEEVSGNKGAGEIAKVLQQKLVDHDEKLSFILDEGMFVMKNVFPGVEDPVAYVGVVEKGWANVELSVNGVQGHSSTPPKESAIGILSNAISRLESERQPSRFGDAVEYDTMEYIAPYASFVYKMALGNLWLFRGIVSNILGGDDKTDPIQRTTTAVTIFNAGVKINVIPSEAKASVNHRIHPADTAEGVLQHDIEAIDDDRVEVKLLDTFPPTKTSPYDNNAMPFQIIVNSAFEVFPTAIVTPGTMVANTDTKHYQDLCDAIYRFQPILLTKDDLSRFHGIDERITVKNYAQVVEFYHRLIHNADNDIVPKSSAKAVVDDDLVDNYDELFENQIDELQFKEGNNGTDTDSEVIEDESADPEVLSEKSTSNPGNSVDL